MYVCLYNGPRHYDGQLNELTCFLHTKALKCVPGYPVFDRDFGISFMKSTERGREGKCGGEGGLFFLELQC